MNRNEMLNTSSDYKLTEIIKIEIVLESDKSFKI